MVGVDANSGSIKTKKPVQKSTERVVFIKTRKDSQLGAAKTESITRTTSCNKKQADATTTMATMMIT